MRDKKTIKDFKDEIFEKIKKVDCRADACPDLIYSSAFEVKVVGRRIDLYAGRALLTRGISEEDLLKAIKAGASHTEGVVDGVLYASNDIEYKLRMVELEREELKDAEKEILEVVLGAGFLRPILKNIAGLATKELKAVRK